MTDTIQYYNPFFYQDLNKPEITYNTDYPYVEFENQILSGGLEESTINNISLIDAKKRTLKYPKLIGFYFKTGMATEHLDSAMGEAVFYLEVQELMTVVNKSSDGGANKYSMYLKKKNEYIKETFWFSTEDDDYMGGLDYINIKIPAIDISGIRQSKENLDTKIFENTGHNAPETINGSLTRENRSAMSDFTCEYYIYVWQEINDPWFHENGQTISFFPNLNQIADENTGQLNCHQTNSYNLYSINETLNNTALGNPRDDIDGFKLYTHNFTTDFTADTSSNYLTIYKLAPAVGGMPMNDQINIIEPKFGYIYAFYTYRILGAGEFVFDDWNDTNNLTN